MSSKRRSGRCEASRRAGRPIGPRFGPGKGGRRPSQGFSLPDIDFLIHDDDVVFTKYEGEPSVIYRDAYFNRAPKPGEDDDRPMFRHYAELADGLLARREDLAYEGALFGIDLLHRMQVT